METTLELGTRTTHYNGALLVTRDAEDWQGECDGRLAERWTDFVGCNRRLETEGPFLLNILGRRGVRVLDAAMGIGCESIFLARHGFRVTGNEISPTFRRLAEGRAQSEAVRFDVTAIDWTNLSAVFGRNTFDAVLILGNSLCLLRDAEARRQAVLNFREVCAKGGTVLVDERNFEYILRNRAAILDGDFRYSGRVMYCGTEVSGRPTAIDSECVRFTYEYRPSGDYLGHLDMHPFCEGEMAELFNQAGLTCIERYSDLAKGYRGDADFYTYVFSNRA